MPKYDEICNGVKHSTARARQAHETGKLTLRQKFNMEMNCKNQAYYFIIKHGLLKSFNEFLSSCPGGVNWHVACFSELVKLTQKDNK